MKLNKLRILVCALIGLSGILQCLWGQGPSSAKTHVGTKPHKKPAGKPAAACEICGVERWDVKTLTDPGASSVDFSPVTKTVAELTSEPAPNDPSKRNLAEQRTYQVRARLVGYKQEFNPASTAKSHGDHDFHIVLADLNDPSKTMIVEIPDPLCSGACTSPKLGEIQKAREDFLKGVKTAPDTNFAVVQGNVEVEVTGVGFFDFAHGQTGLAPNCVELHPVIAFQFPAGQPVLAVHGHGPNPLTSNHCMPQGAGRGGHPKPPGH